MRHLINGKDYEAAMDLTHDAAQIIGLDDMARYPDIDRHSNNQRFLLVAGAEAAILDLVTELNDRATEGGDGYDESPRNKAIARRAVRRAIRAGYRPRE